MHRTLSVGIATLDIVNTVEDYPSEDSEVRALSHRIRRGGNAANTADALAQLGTHSRWLGVLADDTDARHILDSFETAGVDYTGAPVIRGGKVPTSYITLSRTTGSRTIVHYRDLRELLPEDFAAIDLTGLDWVHFEGRDAVSCLAMIHDARVRAPGITVSCEIEKPRQGIGELAPACDVVFYSRAYARSRMYRDARTFLAEHVSAVFDNHGTNRGDSVHGNTPGSTVANTPERAVPEVFCAWGEGGAWLRSPDGAIHHEPPRSLPAVVDSIGAGDAFNAAAIHTMLESGEALDALREANRIAADTCTREGINISK
ncbi:MAG: PfkB family carbohydrate kinase [Spirochaetia bacterium]